MKTFFNWQDQATERVAQWILRRPVWVQFAAYLFIIGCAAGIAYLFAWMSSPRYAWVAAVVVTGGALLSLVVKVVIKLKR